MVTKKLVDVKISRIFLGYPENMDK